MNRTAKLHRTAPHRSSIPKSKYVKSLPKTAKTTKRTTKRLFSTKPLRPTSSLFTPTAFSSSRSLKSPHAKHGASSTSKVPTTRYLGWQNCPPNLHWADIARVFQLQGFQVKVDQDPMANSYARIKFQNDEECELAFEKMNGFVSAASKEPMQLHRGRLSRPQLASREEAVVARLQLISGPTNLAWTVIKDALQAYVPIISVDQVAHNVYKVRLFRAVDYTFIEENLVNKRVQSDFGHIVFSMRPWVVSKTSTNRTSAQLELEKAFSSARPKFVAPFGSKSNPSPHNPQDPTLDQSNKQVPPPLDEQSAQKAEKM